MTRTSLLPSLSQPTKKVGRRNEAIAAYVFLTPWLLGFFLLTIGPILYSLYLSFTSYNLLSPPRWIGLDNFRTMFQDQRYLQSVDVTLKYVGFSVPLHLSVSLFVAMLLNRDMKFQSFYRSAFYLPSLLGGSVALAVLWRQVWGSSGIVNAGLALLGIHHETWTGDPSTALLTLIVLRIWAFGATMVIFLAGLRQIPSEYYEAAQVDGANGFQCFRSITLPLLTPIIFFNLILDLVASLGAFTSAFVISGGSGGPADSTLFYTLYLYIQGFAQLNMGFASAMAWMLFLVLAIITGAIFWSAKYWVHYGDK